jgi:hypothetical protein
VLKIQFGSAMRLALIACSCLFLLNAPGASSATLEKLTLDDMIQKSTAIVRGRVAGSTTRQHGPMIYTHLTVQVTDRWKGSPSGTVDVVTPGGSVQGLSQSFAGVPQLDAGTEYVFFLWTSKTGLTHVIGLSQGVFNVATSDQGDTVILRAPTTQVMLDPATGKPMKDEAVRMQLKELKSRIGQVLSGVKQ